MRTRNARSYLNYLPYITAIAIALSFQLPIWGQGKTDASLGNIRQELASEWENAVLADSLESITPVSAIKFSPDGQLLASVGASQITLWKVNDGKIQRVLPGHYASDIGLEIAPTAIAFSADSHFLATSTWSQGLLRSDQTIIVRDVATGEIILKLSEAKGCRQVLFARSGKIIYGACGNGITAWSFPEGEKLFSFAVADSIEAIALSRDGQVMATVAANLSGKEANNQIQLWQLDDTKTQLLKTLAGNHNEIAQLEFTPNGRQLVSSSYDGSIKVWNWREGTISSRTNNLQSDDGVFSLSPNSQLIAGNFYSSPISSLVTGLPLRNALKLGRNQKSSIIAFHPQRQLFARVQNNIERNSLIDLWSAEQSPSLPKPSSKDNYQEIPVNKYWLNQEHQKTILTSEPQLNKPVSIGKDPQAIALTGLGLTELDGTQDVKVDYSDPQLAIVMITQTNLADDSLAARRYLLQFAPYSEQTKKKWQIVWVGEQFQCHPGRGHQDWGKDFCQ